MPEKQVALSRKATRRLLYDAGSDLGRHLRGGGDRPDEVAAAGFRRYFPHRRAGGPLFRSYRAGVLDGYHSPAVRTEDDTDEAVAAAEAILREHEHGEDAR